MFNIGLLNLEAKANDVISIFCFCKMLILFSTLFWRISKQKLMILFFYFVFVKCWSYFLHCSTNVTLCFSEIVSTFPANFWWPRRTAVLDNTISSKMLPVWVPAHDRSILQFSKRQTSPKLDQGLRWPVQENTKWTRTSCWRRNLRVNSSSRYKTSWRTIVEAEFFLSAATRARSWKGFNGYALVYGLWVFSKSSLEVGPIVSWLGVIPLK
jgi:hypothetical protein